MLLASNSIYNYEGDCINSYGCDINIIMVSISKTQLEYCTYTVCNIVLYCLYTYCAVLTLITHHTSGIDNNFKGGFNVTDSTCILGNDCGWSSMLAA